MYHKDLEAWKKSIDLVAEIYELTKNFPEDEKFGIVNQMRRAAISIPSNIAEGTARGSDKEAIRFLDISIGSLAELETQIIISEKLKYITDTTIYEQINSTAALISGLKNTWSINLKTLSHLITQSLSH